MGERLNPSTEETHTSRSDGRVYISGTGRAGTTLLVQLLTRLGLDTGFDLGTISNNAEIGPEQIYFQQARAGYEKDIFDLHGPRIIKSPYLCDNVDAVIAAGIKIEHVIIPVRKFEDAAASRRFVQLDVTGEENGESVAGGLWDTDNADRQEDVIKFKFANLVEALVRNDVPITFLKFPHFVDHPDYLFHKLRFLLSEVRWEDFVIDFEAEIKPGLVHDFSEEKTFPSKD